MPMFSFPIFLNNFQKSHPLHFLSGHPVLFQRVSKKMAKCINSPLNPKPFDSIQNEKKNKTEMAMNENIKKCKKLIFYYANNY
jgi:hypothetical protein